MRIFFFQFSVPTSEKMGNFLVILGIFPLMLKITHQPSSRAVGSKKKVSETRNILGAP